MTSLRSLFVPALLATAATLTACSDKSPRDDLEGMTDSIAAACPTENPTPQDKLNCATVGKQHALTLFEYSGSMEQFKKACTFQTSPIAIPVTVEALLAGSQANRCLSVIEGAAADEQVKKVAGEINHAMRAGLTAGM